MGGRGALQAHHTPRLNHSNALANTTTTKPDRTTKPRLTTTPTIPHEINTTSEKSGKGMSKERTWAYAGGGPPGPRGWVKAGPKPPETASKRCKRGQCARYYSTAQHQGPTQGVNCWGKGPCHLPLTEPR